MMQDRAGTGRESRAASPAALLDAEPPVQSPPHGTGPGSAKVILVGSPNVGKSVVFGTLTGRYVVVSNYPGTTVEISEGQGSWDGRHFEVIDTPGLYSLHPITEEERVTRSVLLAETPMAVVQVADARNIERMLPIALQLIEAGLPVLLDLNLMDEAERCGVVIDTDALERELGIPVVATVATQGRGLDSLRARIPDCAKGASSPIRYETAIEAAIETVAQCLDGSYTLSKRAIALLLLQEDAEMASLVQAQSGPDRYRRIMEAVHRAKQSHSEPLTYVIALARQERVRQLLQQTTVTDPSRRPELRERLSRLMMHPLTGLPFLFLVIYAFYLLVGVFGAQTAVQFIEQSVFAHYLIPPITRLVESIFPWPVLQDLFVHDYGIVTLGIRYAVAIVLPIVATFFLAFSAIEDTGYLPRLAMLIDRLFKGIGLSGRAVIPVVLGFGCDTMATMVTRTLETKRERVIATFLLGLAIPCSAQIGVILALLAGNTTSLWLFIGIMAGNFFLIGYLSAQVLPGERPMFYVEVPPLRWPHLSNILTKTLARVEWYFKEILPLFILASVLIWAGKITGVFDVVIEAVAYPVRWIGLPEQAATVFLFGFFRRDYGAAGLYDLKAAGALRGIPLLVSVVTLALFMPCIAQFSITIKERGWKSACGMATFIFFYAFFVGFVLNETLTGLGVVL